ncbi:MAG: site-specific DNA-methyltransferase [bacterium]
MKKLTKYEIDFLIKTLKSRKELPLDYKYQLFPTKQKEYELAYAGKMRKEDLLANEDGVFPVPLQVEKVFNGDEYEAFGDNWKNMIVFGDNLQFLKTIYENKDPLIKSKVKGKVKLIYIDPPFATTDDFQNKEGAKAYTDKKKGAEFVEFLRKRLILANEILADDGSIFVHLDYKKAHYIKLLLDEIFGENKLINEIIWAYTGPGSPNMKQFNRKHDTIFWYSKSDKWTFNKDDVRMPYKDPNQSLRKAFDTGEGWDSKDLEELRDKGKVPEDWWEFSVAARLRVDGVERTGYPTEKPNKFMERIIKAASNEGDIVMDFFGGSGATSYMAEKLGRKWITCDLGKLAYFTMQKRILQIQNSKDLENPKKKYSKKAKSFVTAQLGIYDLKKALDLEWQKYQEFVSGLFEVEIKKNKIAGFEFDGKKGDFPVKIFDYRKFKNSAINENYLKEMHGVIGKKAGGRVYIIAPANFVEFLTNYYEIDGVKYYFLKIPYHVIKELHKTPFQELRQPQSKKNVNDLDEAIGFHFIRHPEVKSQLKKSKNEVKILIKSFVSHEFESDKAQDEKGMKNFETFSAVFIDKSYNGKAFEMDEAFFADELLPKKTKKKEEDKNIKEELKKIQKKGLEISFKKSELGKKVMVIYTDIYGNDFTETFTI